MSYGNVFNTNLSQISFGITMSSLSLISLLNSFSVYSKYKFFDKHLKTFSSNVGNDSSRIPFSLRLTWPLIVFQCFVRFCWLLLCIKKTITFFALLIFFTCTVYLSPSCSFRIIIMLHKLYVVFFPSKQLLRFIFYSILMIKNTVVALTRQNNQKI